MIPISGQNQKSTPWSQRKLRCTLLVGAALLGIGTLFFLSKHLHQTTQTLNMANHRSLVMLNALHSLQNQLLKSEDKAHSPANAIFSLSSQLAKVENSVANTAKTTDLKKMSDRLIAIQADLVDLEKTISGQLNSKKFTDPKSLPFQVDYLDMISGHPFVSVDYDHHMAPLGIGDSLNGWTLSAADYGGQTVEFTNVQGQYVKINLGDDS